VGRDERIKIDNARKFCIVGRVNEKLIRKVKYITFNGVIASLTYFAIAGNIGAGRLLVFTAWLYAVLFLLAAIAPKDATDQIRQKGRTFPAWMSNGLACLIIAALVWHGWIFTAIAFLIWEISEALIYNKK
jgi:hypothetical protein